MVDCCQTGNLATHVVSVTVQNGIIIGRGALEWNNKTRQERTVPRSWGTFLSRYPGTRLGGCIIHCAQLAHTMHNSHTLCTTHTHCSLSYSKDRVICNSIAYWICYVGAGFDT
jgi:hypothetical protein